MAIEIELLRIERIVFHQIFRRNISNQIVPPLYSKECTEFDDRAKNALRERIIHLFGSKSNSIEMEIQKDDEDSAFGMINNYWSNERTNDSFIAFSKKITDLLTRAQRNRIMSGGIVSVIEGTVSLNKNRFICIIKADVHDGFNLSTSGEELKMSYIPQLLLTPAQKLQKMGMFIDNSSHVGKLEKTEVVSYLFDSNTSANSTMSKADYFYNGFLGLCFSSKSKYITQKFYICAKEFFNQEDSLSTTERHDLQTKLLTYLKYDYAPVINPLTFSKEYIGDKALEDKFQQYMVENQIPLRDIFKDIELIERSTKTRKLNFENKVKVSAPADGFSDNVEIIEDDNGNTIVKIRGKLLYE